MTDKAKPKPRLLGLVVVIAFWVLMMAIGPTVLTSVLASVLGFLVGLWVMAEYVVWRRYGRTLGAEVYDDDD